MELGHIFQLGTRYSEMMNGKYINQEGKEASFQTDCFEDFWQGFVSSAKCNLHLDTIRGRSDHHKMEGLFKAAARAIREAVEIDARRRGEIPSTKGVIVQFLVENK